MCGIIGFANFDNGKELAKNGLKIMKNRGRDSSRIFSHKSIVLGHNLHSIINFVKQPLCSSSGCLVSNNEIYNWKEINKKYSLRAKNDSDLILKLIDKKGTEKIDEIVSELDGDFAFAYYSKEKQKIFLARDIIGVKPLVYYYNEETKQFAFASEKKALHFGSQNLSPRKILSFHIETGNLSFINLELNNKVKMKKPSEEIKQSLLKAVSKRIPEKKFALLLSGGIDSALIGKILQNDKIKFNSYFACIKDLSAPKDLEFAKKASYELNSVVRINLVSLKEFESTLPKIISLIESVDPVRVGIASTIYFATKIVREKICFSGLGADELFAGYNRFNESNDINKDCYSYLIKMYENDLYFEDIVTMSNRVELRVPFLDKEFVSKALLLSQKYKVDKKNNINKKILREFAFELGLPKEIAFRPKKAAQYGSNFDKALEFLAKKNKFKSKALYLQSLQEKAQNINNSNKNKSNKKIQKLLSKKNIPIASLVSTGKDSIFALHLMKKQGYEIKCLITIDSKNKDSFMFHTPTIALAKLQAEAMNIPLIIVKTLGKKEIELKDLEKAIKKAILVYKIEGVSSGALFSNYQRERIEKITEKIGIRHFAPLWHMNQEKYMRQLLKENFKIMITKIACLGLDKDWLGRIITTKDIDSLVKLSKKYGVNVAGEGGEYETLVISAPLFSKKISVRFSKKMENDFTGEIKISKSKLEV